ncbi:MAG: phosphoribosylglycinamide formyltransferase [Bacteroidota bacterium]|nr:phosphoribosylglycinamide formyltransferase [Bacteroidota bacterium]
MKTIAIFASGSGTNAQNLIEYFNKTVEKKVILVLSNKKDAIVLERAEKLGVQTEVFDRGDLYENGRVLYILSILDPDLIILAGFLWLVPVNILRKFPNRVVNIHPALLPKYGGKGMFGMNVHRAILQNRESQSGISIHFVNEEYDKGDIIFQAYCDIEDSETPESLASKVHQLEYKHFPEVINGLLNSIQ